jgi:hypothetical protein
MVRWRRMTALNAAVAFACGLAGLAPRWAAGAQVLSNICATQFGNCVANPAPVGSPCGCLSNGGAVPGEILPPAGGYGFQERSQAIGNACRTNHGICQTYPAPIGSPCGCFGDPGTVIGR